MWTKRYVGLLCSTIGLFMCIIYRINVSQIETELAIDDHLLDHELVSIEDYSIRGKISREFYDLVVNRMKPPADNPDSLSAEERRANVPIRRFQSYLTDLFQKELQEKGGLDAEMSKVADIVFAFNNREMLKLLKQRYDCLCKCKYDEARKVEEELTKLKDSHYDELVVPNTYYCTFMRGEAQNVALELHENRVLTSDGHQVECLPCKSPQDILWLNRGISKCSQLKRGLFVVFIILVVIMIVYFLFTVEVQAKIYIKYRGNPPGIVCNQLLQVYNERSVQQAAALEYLYLNELGYSQLSNLNSRVMRSGYLACFCEKQAENGFDSDQMYKFNYRQQSFEEPICKAQMEFMSLFGYAMLVSYLMSGAVVAQSFLARVSLIHMSKFIKFTSASQLTRFMIISVFIIYFLNYGLMYLLAPLKFQVPLLSYFQLGIYEDFNQYWYGDIGFQIITVVVVHAITPPGELIALLMVKRILQSWDQRKCCRKRPPQATQKNTLNSYRQLYSGLNFPIHQKYSQICVVAWVTFLFAPGLPILFPIGLFAFCVQYMTNRVFMAYYAKRPPVYDEKMNTTTVKMLGFAPILYVCVGAWVYSNQQTFNNSVQPKIGEQYFMDPNHSFSDFWYQVNPGSVFVVYILALLVLQFGRLFVSCLGIERCLSIPKRVQMMQVSQELAPFYQSLKNSQRESFIREEVQDHIRLGTSKLSKETLLELVLAPKVDDKELRLSGDVSYRILRHEIAQEFNFRSPGLSGHKQTDFVLSQYTKDIYKMCSLDIVNAVAYLAFIERDEALQMKLHAEDIFIKRTEIENQQEEDDLVSDISSKHSSESDDAEQRLMLLSPKPKLNQDDEELLSRKITAIN